MPLRKSPLVLSALVVGTMAPDLEYFIRLAPGGGWGHTIPGAFGLSLPLGLITLWMYHAFVKRPALALLPVSVQRRAAPGMPPFRMSGLRRFASIVVSLLVGIATHIIWDSFTHETMWTYRHWSFLRIPLKLPHGHWLPIYSLLQDISSVGGLGVLAWWITEWYRRTPPGLPHPGRTLTTVQKWKLILWILCSAIAGGLFRAIRGTSGMPRTHYQQVVFFGEFIVTFIAVLWWELVALGITQRALRPSYTRAQT